MLKPSWLLTGFTLETSGSLTVNGRDALRVTATPRPGRWGRPAAGRRRADRVEVIVDAGLGILLRHEEILDGSPLRATELTDVRIDSVPPGDDAGPRRAAGSASRTTGPPFTADGPGWEVVKLTAGLAAAGLGALIKSSRFRPFEQATREEAEAEMPAFDRPMAADGPPVSDEMLHLIYASPDRWAPGIAATLHEWHDVERCWPARRTARGAWASAVLATSSTRRASASPPCTRSHGCAWAVRGSTGSSRCSSPARPARAASDRDRHLRRGAAVADRRGRGDRGPAAPPFGSRTCSTRPGYWDARLIGGEEVVTGGRRGYRLRGSADVKPPG